MTSFLLMEPEKEAIADLLLRHADKGDDFVIDRVKRVYPSGFQAVEVECDMCMKKAYLVYPAAVELPGSAECSNCGHEMYEVEDAEL